MLSSKVFLCILHARRASRSIEGRSDDSRFMVGSAADRPPEPVRMECERVIPIVDITAKRLSNALSVN